jgi:hypothetical protein
MTTKTAVIKRGDKIGCIEKIVMNFDESKDLFIRICDDQTEIRTLAMNRLLRKFYNVIAENLGDVSDDIEARCKRKFGIPLMKEQALGNTKKANDVYLRLVQFGIIPTESPAERKTIMINFWTLPDIGQLEAIKLLPVTRNFGIKLMRRYIENIQIWAAQEHNIVLESINEKNMLESYQC